ncbi:MAG: ATP-dependent DNA helicase RecG, partial [Pseudomonadota bacterium]
LAYDELLAGQVALAAVRRAFRQLSGRSITGTGEKSDQIVGALPFSLTSAQTKAIEEIRADMATPAAMLRLLQGDVGSGKTLVALLALATAAEAGLQGAFLAPTEILARQHFAALSTMARPAGLTVALLTAREKGRVRDSLLLGLADGDIDILVGTHALIGDQVNFRDLGLAVIDEQHRFGVHQRLALARKGKGVDTLVMTATPIPRTLQLTAYGDMAVTQILEKPAGRREVDTRVLPNERVDQVIEALARTLDRSEKAFWVCPLVEESDQSDLMDASARFHSLQARFGDRVGLVHGRMKGAEKDAVMARFAGKAEQEEALFPDQEASAAIDILVATTVVEVGVDVPDATVMVIEHAERFGLAQLHQLRGRVGRGEKPGVCLLLYAPPLGETARERLKTLRETNDGFKIAEQDLTLRGGGEVLGTKQSGLPEFRMADLAFHADLLAMAHDDARLLMDRDPELETERGQAIRTLLYLFEQDVAVRTLRSG